MRNIWKILLLLAIVSSGCKDNWDEFYGEEEDERIAGSKITILESLKQMPERYSKFLQLLKETGMERELNSDRVVTVWVPEDSYMTDNIMTLDSADKRRFVLNHINNLALYRTKLASKNEVKTLAEKYIQISGGGNNFYVEKVKVSSLDHICKNGVYHVISGLLTPTKNLMEYILECGPEYSIYRDSLLAYNDTVFRPDLSFPLGVDDVGQTIYDSVFDIKNKLLGNVDFKSEKSSYTLLLPSNAVIENMIQELHDYLDFLGIKMTHKDTLDCFQFIMRGSYLGFSINNFFGIKKITAGGGSELRLDRQLISSAYEKYSNGNVYKFEKMYMPRSKMLKTVTYTPVDLFLFPEDQWQNYYQLSYGGTISNVDDHTNGEAKNTIFSDNSAPARKFISVIATAGQWLELSLIQKNIYAEVEPVKLIPGKYRLSGWAYGYKTANVKMYVNGTPVLWHKNKSTTIPMGSNNGTDGFEFSKRYLIADTIYVAPKSGPDVVRLESLGTGTLNNAIRLKELLFEPVGDNY